MMRVLIGSDDGAVGELRALLECAGHTVDVIAAGRLDGVRQMGYNFVIVDGRRADGTLRNGSIELRPGSYVVKRSRKVVRVTPLEFRILQCFMERPGEIVTREDLVMACWGRGAATSRNTIEVYVKRIRGKFGAGVVRTIHGVGYQMDRK